MNKVRIIFAAVMTMALFSCKTQKDMSNMDQLAIGELRTTLDTAIIVIPMNARLEDVKRFIEETLSEFEMGKPGDDLQVKATLTPGMGIEVTEDTLKLDIPLDLDITQGTFLGKVRANGAIRIQLETRYDIDVEWNLSTSTHVSGHQWTRTPEAKMSVIKLSVETLADRLIERYKGQLSSQIDGQVAENINLRKSINDIWYRLRAPMEVSEEYKVWLQMKPVALSVSRLHQSDNKVTAYIKAKTSPKVSIGDRPIDFSLDSIPMFEWLVADTSGYIVPMQITIPDQEIADISNVYLADETFDLGKKKIKVNDVDIQRSGNRWKVNLALSGDVLGKVTMHGRPVWNDRKGKVELADFDYAVDSRNILLKSSALLFRQKIERQLVNQINELIDDRREEVLKTIKEQLLKTNENQWLSVANKIEKFKIHDLGLDDKGMWVYVLMTGNLDAQFEYQSTIDVPKD